MERYVSDVSNVSFDIERLLDTQSVYRPLLFDGMDKSTAPFCVRDLRNECQLGDICPYRHKQKDKTVVCTYWLRNLCKKGDKCDYLHEYDKEKMPLCQFFAKNQCGNKNCIYRHVEKKVANCPWFDRGFCRHGSECKNKHEMKVICQNFALGICTEGQNCQLYHPNFDLPVGNPTTLNQVPKCIKCGENGHMISSCPLMKMEINSFNATIPPSVNNGQQPFRPLDQVTCFKCGQKGHYANKCNTGMFGVKKMPANYAVA